MARNRRRTTFQENYSMIVCQYACRLNVNILTSFHPGNELKADALNSHLVETEEFPYPQDRPCSLAR
jgi:hypothetical protein